MSSSKFEPGLAPVALELQERMNKLIALPKVWLSANCNRPRKDEAVEELKALELTISEISS